MARVSEMGAVACCHGPGDGLGGQSSPEASSDRLPAPPAKIGRMALAHGAWQGRQVVPADWVAESLHPHITAGDGLGYGYQWWTGTLDRGGKKLAWSAGFGNGGQRLFIVPELDLTVVINAGAYNNPQIRRAGTEIFRQILMAVRS